MGFFSNFLYDNLNSERREYLDDCRREARNYRAEAKSILSDAKELYEDDYKELKKDARRMANQLGEHIQSHNKYKVELLKELGDDISGAIDSFKAFDIGSHVIKSISLDSGSFSMPTVPSFSNAFGSAGSLSLLNLAFSSVSDPERDRDKAQEQKWKAEEYLANVESAINDMRYTIEKLRGTEKYIGDEREMLDQLMSKVRGIIQQLKSAMHKDSHTETEANYMTGICKIAEMIKRTLEEQLAADDGSLRSSYKQYSQHLNDINRAIPSRPNISESGGWLDMLLKMGEAGKRY